MCAAGIAALLKKMDYKDVVVAVDGSLFWHHPHFQGSGRGAALVAAVLKIPKLRKLGSFLIIAVSCEFVKLIQVSLLIVVQCIYSYLPFIG